MNKDLRVFLKDAEALFALPELNKYKKLVLPEYPFDSQLLSMSEIYRRSRKQYFAMGGKFSAKLCSVARSLSSQDLFKSEIDYSPMLSELIWFKDHFREVAEPDLVLELIKDFNGVSLFHEQNHRIVWQCLPPPPSERVEFCRYLNFAESLVVALDLALADEIGKKLSPSFERMKTVYRTGGEDSWAKNSKARYRKYLYANVFATYFLLELYEPEDIHLGLSHIFPTEKKMVKDAVKRSLDLSDLFILKTNQLWQDLNWQRTEQSLTLMHADSGNDYFYLPEDPLELGEEELSISARVFDLFGL